MENNANQSFLHINLVGLHIFLSKQWNSWFNFCQLISYLFFVDIHYIHYSEWALTKVFWQLLFVKNFSRQNIYLYGSWSLIAWCYMGILFLLTPQARCLLKLNSRTLWPKGSSCWQHFHKTSSFQFILLCFNCSVEYKLKRLY